MRKSLPYKGVEYTLNQMRYQIRDSLPYCRQHFSGLNTPQQMWNRLKPLVRYVQDPPNVELLQSVPTMMNRRTNWHRIAGAGDCDCFTILVLSTLKANPVYNSVDKFAVLVGNTWDEPTHIYAAVKWKGRLIAIDLTNPALNVERPYKFRQYVPLP